MPDTDPLIPRHSQYRHFFVAGKSHVCLSRCAGWWREPRGLLALAARVSLTSILPEELRAEVRYMNTSRFGLHREEADYGVWCVA